MHKSGKKLTIEQNCDLRKKNFIFIHGNLNKRKNLVYKSQRHNIITTTDKSGKTMIDLNLYTPYLSDEKIACVIECKNPICVFSYYCYHLKPSVIPLMPMISISVKNYVKSYLKKFVF
jgi:hypothetical protein